MSDVGNFSHRNDTRTSIFKVNEILSITIIQNVVMLQCKKKLKRLWNYNRLCTFMTMKL